MIAKFKLEDFFILFIAFALHMYGSSGTIQTNLVFFGMPVTYLIGVTVGSLMWIGFLGPLVRTIRQIEKEKQETIEEKIELQDEEK